MNDGSSNNQCFIRIHGIIIIISKLYTMLWTFVAIAITVVACIHARVRLLHAMMHMSLLQTILVFKQIINLANSIRILISGVHHKFGIVSSQVVFPETDHT
jgi:hypothetical protein